MIHTKYESGSGALGAFPLPLSAGGRAGGLMEMVEVLGRGGRPGRVGPSWEYWVKLKLWRGCKRKEREGPLSAGLY